MPFVDAPLGPYTNAYIRSSEFPEPAIEVIPERLLTAIDAGNKAFFANFAEAFPKTFLALTEQCPPLRLLEVVVRKPNLPGKGEDKDYLYWWGCSTAGRLLLLVNIPDSAPDDPLRVALQSKYLTAIPKSFEVFYQRMDGMAITTGAALLGFDLPNSFSDWHNLNDYYTENGLDPFDAFSLSDQLGGDDLRVFFTARSGDFVIVNLGGTSRALYTVRRENPGSAIVLDNPSFKLDGYFSRAILSPKENLPFLVQ